MSDLEPEDHGPVKPFLDHLEDLRKLLIRIVLVLVISCSLCGYYADRIMEFLMYPLAMSGIQGSTEIVALNPGAAFSLPFTLAIYGGLTLAAPIVLYLIAGYILPALTRKEKKYIGPAFYLGGFFFLLGTAICYFLLLPTTLKMSKDFADWMHVKMNAWTVDSYVSFVTTFMLGMGITFEFPLVLLVLAKIGIVSYQMLASSRRYAIVLILILSAVVTPSSDAITMCFMALPLVLLFEFCIWAAWFMQRKKTTEP